MSKIYLLLHPTVLKVSALVCLLSVSASAQNIQLDPTFGVGGKVTVGFSDTGLRSSHAYHVFAQPSGRIVVFGGHISGGQLGTPSVAACGLTSTGALDTGFGNGGKILELNNMFVNGVEALPNGQFLRLLSGGFPNTTVLNRLNSNGSVDSSFVANLNIGSNITPVSVTTRSDGKIVVFLRGIGGDDSNWVVRLNANGSRDGSFGNNGVLLLNFRRPSRAAAIGLHILPDNRILVGGYLSTSGAPSGGNVAWAALGDETGNYDRRFGLQGVTRVPFAPGGIRISKTLLQPDGKILLIGHAYGPANSSFMILRLTSRGRLDTGFGQNGIAIAPNITPDSFDVGYSAVLMSDGRIVVVGTYAATQGSPALVLVARFGANGVRESYALTQFTPDQSSFASSVAIQADGKLVVAGYTRNPDASADGNLFAIARYTQ